MAVDAVFSQNHHEKMAACLFKQKLLPLVLWEKRYIKKVGTANIHCTKNEVFQ